MIEHGFTRYGYGCRCDVCKAGKAAYMRKRRAKGREARLSAEAEGRRFVAEGVTHGLFAYQIYGCRCFACRVSNAEQAAKYRAQRAERSRLTPGR